MTQYVVVKPFRIVPGKLLNVGVVIEWDGDCVYQNGSPPVRCSDFRTFALKGFIQELGLE